MKEEVTSLLETLTVDELLRYIDEVKDNTQKAIFTATVDIHFWQNAKTGTPADMADRAKEIADLQYLIVAKKQILGMLNEMEEIVTKKERQPHGNEN